MTVGPLSGLKVVVTRPRAQAFGLIEGLEAAGADVVPVPVIVIDDPVDGGASLRAGIKNLAAGDWLVVTSSNGATRVGEMIEAAPLAAEVMVAAIGPATAQAATEAGMVVDLVPDRSIAEGLLEVFPAPPTSGGRVVLARAETARDVLPEGLVRLGWWVDDLVAYRNVGVEVDAQGVEACQLADVVIFTSSSTVTRLIESVGVDGLPPVIASIGPATSATVRNFGARATVEAEDHTIAGLLDALTDHVSSR